MKTIYFDHAATTPCYAEASEALQAHTCTDFGNPSSSHRLGKQSLKAIDEARGFFAATFEVSPAQIIFTGSGSEADNLAVYGVALHWLETENRKPGFTPRVICSKTEHAAIRKTVQSLESLGIDVKIAPVDPSGQLILKDFEALLTPSTVLVSIHQVNNISGAELPVEKLAALVKTKVPTAVFHTDAVQAFGKVAHPKSNSAVDLVSISAHKVYGPKGCGALVVLNPALLKSGLRPVIWGGGQEGGFRSGTQSPGLISAFHLAAQKTLEKSMSFQSHTTQLRTQLKEALIKRGLLGKEADSPVLCWNSPENGVPYIVNISAPGYPGQLLAGLLEERGCIVSIGSACSSKHQELDAVLCAMGYPESICSSALRISFGNSTTSDQIETLATALADSLLAIQEVMGGPTQLRSTH